MRAEPAGPAPARGRLALLSVALAAAVGIGLLADSSRRSSATYDEVAYLRIAARWWRTGDQQQVTRMGSPLTFWKLQQIPVLWLLDRLGRGDWVDDPIGHQAELLPLVRFWSAWIWLAALGVTALWSRQLYGPRAMALAAWLFALSPNLLAHGALVTMELPLLASSTAMYFLFWRFLRFDERRAFLASALLGGLAWSCKFTTVLVPPLLALAWCAELWQAGERGPIRVALRVTRGMTGFVALIVLANFVLTGFALLPLSETAGLGHPSLDTRLGPVTGRWAARALEVPIPQDWAGFARQVLHQRSGGPSYLLGERRMTGWWYYYFVALAVKVPLTFWLLVAARAALFRRTAPAAGDVLIPLSIGAFLVITAVGSARNYGLRYLLPLAPLAIVWVSALAEGGRGARRWACLGLIGQAVAVAACHPHELTYFNACAGGPVGGRRILADSNLDWGQGLRALARLQGERPQLRDLTLYYFGDTDPKHYGVVGRCYVIDATSQHPGLPASLGAETSFLAVSASLAWGPWGPDGYFQDLAAIAPVTMTDDHTIAVYRASDLPARK